MRKLFKILFLFSISLFVIGLSKNVNASYIKKISMDIFIDNNGNAEVKEIWDCDISEGTELKHLYYNLNNSIISDLKVEENERQYTYLNSWDPKGSFNGKAYKCGINNVYNGVELCWGVSKYGEHEYSVTYKISNLIYQLKDCQMLCCSFIPNETHNVIGEAYIKIHSNFSYSNDWEVYGFGEHDGTCYLHDGYIEMQANNKIMNSEYMTVLSKIPNGTFNTTNKLKHDFDYYYKMEKLGRTRYKSKGQMANEKINKIISYSLYIFVCLFLIFIGAIIILLIYRNSDTLFFGKNGKKISKDIPYFRDIPCQCDLFRAYYIGYKYGIIKNKANLLGAILLKWVKKGLVRLEKVDKNREISNETISIIFENDEISEITDPTEKDIYIMMMEASNDGILEDNEFEIWCSKNYSQLLEWFDNILVDQRDILVDEGLITVEDSGKIFKYEKHTATLMLKQEAIELCGLKKYLKDYTLIKDRGAVGVTLFEEYLIFAQMLGIAKEVANNFKELYPEIIEQSQYNSFENIIFVNTHTERGFKSAISSKKNADFESRVSSYTSGGGGFSSGGGGGGSFGGGGGRWRLQIVLIYF